MIGARDMESAILGQYAEFVRRTRPDAPVPGFYLAEGLFKDAYKVKQEIGEGGYSKVYRARHIASGRDVAVKVTPKASGLSEADKVRPWAEMELECLEKPRGKIPGKWGR
jgi:serine/threonine protein kinase